MDSLIAANIGQRPLRTAISVIGVALGVILVTLFVGLARGMMHDAARRQSSVDAEVRFLPGGNVALAGNPLMLSARYADAILHGVQPTADDPDLEPKPPIYGVAATSAVGEYVQNSVAGIGFEMVDGLDYASFINTLLVDSLPSERNKLTTSSAVMDWALPVHPRTGTRRQTSRRCWGS